jgi:hypothetical protein
VLLLTTDVGSRQLTGISQPFACFCSPYCCCSLLAVSNPVFVDLVRFYLIRSSPHGIKESSPSTEFLPFPAQIASCDKIPFCNCAENCVRPDRIAGSMSAFHKKAMYMVRLPDTPTG